MMNLLRTTSAILTILLLSALTGLLLVSRSAVGLVGTSRGSAITRDAISTEQGASTVSNPASLILSADAIVLPTGDGQAVVTAIVRDSVGQPVAGVEVQFTTTLGSMLPSTATTNAVGIAASTFAAGTVPGQATITVECSGLTQEIYFQLEGLQEGIGALGLEIGADGLLPGEQTSVTVTIRDGVGQPIGGELVTFFGSLGDMSPASGLSDDRGQVTSTFTAGSIPGQATITVLAGYAFSSANIQIRKYSLYLPLVSRSWP